MSFQATEDDVAKQRAKLDSATQVANWLIVKNKDNPQFIANVKAKLKGVEQPLSEISKVLMERKGRLEASLLAAKDHEAVTELYEDNVKNIEKILRKQVPISVVFEKLKKDDDEGKVS